MSVYIKNMEMPECCEDCTFYTLRPVARCTLLGDLITSFDDDRLSDCPMVEVKTPHGRIVDIDAVLDGINNADGGLTCGELIKQTTIIEAEE